jgi:threonyl-tRNA synthetase
MAQITVTLPDGSTRRCPAGVTAGEVLREAGGDAEGAVVAARIDGEVVDLSAKVEKDASVSGVTFDSEEGREVFRHSASHALASAVKKLRPEAELAIGPPIEGGFYYDFDVDEPFTPEDLERFEKEMAEIIAADIPFGREDVPIDDARRMFGEMGEKYKLELLDDIPDDMVSIYRHDDFIDLCRGPHLPSTGMIKAFRLLSVAGAYWRGDERNRMLQRIYGTAFPTQEGLEQYLELLELAEKRDHRRLGKDLDLYSFDQEIGAGLVLWHPKGARIRQTIEQFWIDEHYRRGYELIYSPHIASERVYERSGHLENYADNMYAPLEIEGQRYRLKPMNCPAHIKVYQTKKRSYRDLPYRLCELGTVYRFERGGTLHGMLRVRGFTQDDSHIFCTPEQLADEVAGVLDLAGYMMKAFGYEYQLYLATRPEKSLGTDEEWERSTEALRSALESQGLEYEVDEGGGVFYAPKIDLKLLDALGRGWQGPTIQVDLNLPKRFDVSYVGKDGQEHETVIVHRTVLGSMERFIGGLVEHYGGAFPTWLAPVQVAVLPISESQLEYARSVEAELKAAGLRVETDARDDKIGHKIREAQVQQVPYMLVLGRREVESGAVAVRHRRKGDLGQMKPEEFLALIGEEVESKRIE